MKNVMKRSVINRLRISMYAFGIFMGIVFPFYANFFVSWNKGMKLYFSIGSFMAGLSIGAFSFLMVKLILLREIRKIDTFSNALGNNDLTATINIDSNDDIGRIASNLSNSTNKIKEIISYIVDTSQALTNSLKELQMFATRMNSSATTITDKSQTTTTSMNLVNSSSKISSDAISSSETHISDLIKTVNSLTKSLSIIDIDCKDEATISEIVVTNVSNTKDAITKLSEHSIEIASMADVIKEIADQTNILALNAAVEAARAGSQGKSFAVVANEVKTLASKSMDSALKISSLIDVIQPLIESSKSNVTDSYSKVKELKELAVEVSQETSKQTKMLNVVDKELVFVGDTISNVSTDFKVGSKQINEATDEVLSIDSAITGITDDIYQGSETIMELSQLAGNLKHMTDKFTVK